MRSAELLEKLVPITEEEQKILEGQADIDRSLYMDNAGDVISSSKMLGGGKQIAIRPHTRFVHFPPHSHDFVEIVYMCKGSTTHIVNGNRIELREGNLLFLCQNARQEILPAGKEDIAVNFFVRPSFFDSMLETIGEEDTPLRRFVVDCLRDNRKSVGYLHFEVADVLPVQNMLEILIWTLLFDTMHKRNLVKTTVGLLFLQLLNHTDRLTSPMEEEKTIVKVLRYVETRYKGGSLRELSRLLHYDESTLSREIKNKTGKTYTELVQEKRLSEAAFLLKNTDLGVLEICDRVGYENQSFFHRLFREKYGTTPKKYRDTACK
mgnify:CR=1 FL=1